MGAVGTLTTDADNLTGGINEVHALISATVDVEAFARGVADVALTAADAVLTSAVTTETSARISADNALDDRIDALIVGAGTSSAEVVDSRGGETVLGERLAAMEHGVYNALREPFDAARDGATDDSAEIIAAIVAASDAGGGTVILPEGQYYITAAIEITSENNVIVEGQGDGTTIVFHGSEGVNAFYFIGCTNIVVRNLRIQHTNAAWTNQCTTGVRFANSFRCHADNITVIGHRSASVVQSGEGLRFLIDSGVTMSNSKFCSVQRCHFENVRVAVRFVADAAQFSNTHHCVAMNNTSDTVGRFFQITEPYIETGIPHYVPSSPYDDEWANVGCHNNTLAFNRALNCTQGFGKIDMAAFFNKIIGNSIIGGNNEYATNGVLDLSSGYTTVIGNTFNCPGSLALGIIYVYQESWHCNIDGNTIAPLNGNAGIYLGNNSRFCRIANNIIRGNEDGNGIEAGAGVANMVISGNEIKDVEYGIFPNANDDMVISSNVIFNASNRGIYVIGGERLVIANNQIDTIGLIGINVTSGGKHITITGNGIRNTNAADAAANDDNKSHILIATGASGIAITGNVCTVINEPDAAVSIQCKTAANVTVTGNVTSNGIAGTGTNFYNTGNVVQA